MAAGTEVQEREMMAKSQRMLAVTKDPVERIRLQCLSRGVAGIKRIGQIFRIMDDDGSKHISFEEFKKGISDFGVSASSEELREAFDTFDADDSGCISFDEFLVKLRPAMNQTRTNIIDLAFNKFDKTGDGFVTVADMKGVYNAKHHPKYQNGEWSEQQVFEAFLRNFDSPKTPDHRITKDEFYDYYVGVSASIDNDMYFDHVLRYAWKL